MVIMDAQPGAVLRLGYSGEGNSRVIRFSLKDWSRVYGPGIASLVASRYGDEESYPVPLIQEGDVALWRVRRVDAAMAGAGWCELQYRVNDTVVKQERWVTEVEVSPTDAFSDPEDPDLGYLEQILDAGTLALHAQAESQRLAREVADATAAAVEAAALAQGYVEAVARLVDQIPDLAQGTPDLAQNNPEGPGYVKNRTHYDDRRNMLIPWGSGSIGTVSVETEAGVFWKVAECKDVDTLIRTALVAFELNSGGAFTVSNKRQTAVTDSGIGITTLTSTATLIPKGTMNLLAASVTVKAVTEAGDFREAGVWSEPGIYLAEMPDTALYSYVFSYTERELKKLDEKFIPSEIARVTDVAESRSLTSPDGSRWALSVDDSGTVTAVKTNG